MQTLYAELWLILICIGVLELKSSKTNRNKFERNQKDEFVFDIPDVGNLEKIR